MNTNGINQGGEGIYVVKKYGYPIIGEDALHHDSLYCPGQSCTDGAQAG
jgi:hypothetical protein